MGEKLRIDFEQAESNRERIKYLFEELRNDKRSIYIFGAGIYANELKSYLNNHGISIESFVVDEGYEVGRECVLLSEALNDDVIFIYGIGNGFLPSYHRVIDQLSEKLSRYTNVDLYVFSDYWRANNQHAIVSKDFLNNNISAFEQTYEMLADELSREVMRSYLYAGVSFDATGLEELWTDHAHDYELDLLFSGKSYSGGLIIECGAYDGKSILQIGKYTEMKFDMLALECDLENYNRCCSATKEFNKITVMQKGVWDKETKLMISGQGQTSYIYEVSEEDEEGNIEVVTLDSLARSKKVIAVLMDIEGSELKALRGAKNLIDAGVEFAVRIYHNEEDLVTIPQFIKGINSDYKFYLRYNHSASFVRTGCDTTLYALVER